MERVRAGVPEIWTAWRNEGMAFLEFQDISKQFGNVKAVDHVNLEVKQGEFF